MKKLFMLLFAAGTLASFAKSPILPTPNSVVEQAGEFKIDTKQITVNCNDKTLDKYIKEEFLKRSDLKVKNSKTAQLTIQVSDSKSDDESYTLEINPKGITINAKGYSGAFYGVQSLMQLIRDGQANGVVTLQAQKIEDAPRFGWRSFLMDDARHYKGVAEVKRFIDAMSEMKMNVLHWHLTDDSGWRIEIKKYPLLTEIGSYRKDTEAGTWGSGKTQGKPHSGFYTQAQVKDIVAYAKERAIKVVPEIEMPGHASAAIAAYPWLGSSDDKIEVPITFGKLVSVFNLIDPKVDQFLKDVVSEVIDLFGTGIVHIGGDEVKFTQWENNPEIVKYKNDKGFSSFMDIQIEYTNKMSHFIESKGAVMMGWNEILGKKLHEGEISFEDPSQKVAPNVIVQFWKGDIKELVDAAKGGYQLVNSLHTDTYIDYSYKSIPLTKSYAFDPIPEGLPKEFHKNIIGSGCQGWSEWIPDSKTLHKQVFPRIAAYAEVGWTNKENKNYDDFLVRLEPIKKSWTQAGIEYYTQY